jgi:dTDP-4-amino-4,6-dideoxygalactose transaminase
MGIADGRCIEGASGYKMVVEHPDRDRLKAFLEKHWVGTSRGIYDKPLHMQPIFQDLIQLGQSFPQAEAFAGNHLCLPIWRGLSDEDLTQVLEVIQKFQ